MSRHLLKLVLLDTFWNSTEQQIFKIHPVELIYLSFQFLLAAYSSVEATDCVGATGFTIYTYSGTVNPPWGTCRWLEHRGPRDGLTLLKQHLLDWNSSDLLRLVGEESIFVGNLFESPYMTPHPSFPTTPSVTGQRPEANGLGGDFGILALSEGRYTGL